MTLNSWRNQNGLIFEHFFWILLLLFQICFLSCFSPTITIYLFRNTDNSHSISFQTDFRGQFKHFRSTFCFTVLLFRRLSCSTTSWCHWFIFGVIWIISLPKITYESKFWVYFQSYQSCSTKWPYDVGIERNSTRSNLKKHVFYCRYPYSNTICHQPILL